MKRLIMYTSPYEEKTFSNFSTKYEVLPYVVDDSSGSKELREIAIILGFKPIGKSEELIKSSEKYIRPLSITHTIPVGESVRIDSWTKERDTRRPVETTRLGFITMPERDANNVGLEVNVECSGVLTEENSQTIFDYRAFDFMHVITLDDSPLMLISGWNAYHCLNVLGYTFSQFMKLNGCEETIFEDSVSSCGHCGAYMYNDNGYTYNYRIIDCELLGIECGCYKNHMKNNWQNRIDDTETPIELEVATELEGEGLIEHLERFIGGMTDGRGGYYDGKPTREGNPEEVLAEYQEKYPDKQFIFTHDESGQFQTYFSIWGVK